MNAGLDDPFATWDAAYVLGALTPSDRQAFETHLAGCGRCRAAVAELAGVPGLLALVPKDTALEIAGELSRDADLSNVHQLPPPPPDAMLSRLVAATERKRTRGRLVTIGASVASAAAAVAIAVPVVRSVGPTAPPGPTVVAERTMDPVKDTPLSADFTVLATPGGGTRIDMVCRYDDRKGGYSGEYSMFVTTTGPAGEMVSWPAKPGNTFEFSAVTTTPPEQIRQVDIRSATTGEVVLMSKL